MKQDVSANGSDWKIAVIARLAATCCRFVEVEKGHDGLFQQAFRRSYDARESTLAACFPTIDQYDVGDVVGDRNWLEA